MREGRRDVIEKKTRICIEGDGNIGIFDPQHRMIELQQLVKVV